MPIAANFNHQPATMSPLTMSENPLIANSSNLESPEALLLELSQLMAQLMATQASGAEMLPSNSISAMPMATNPGIGSFLGTLPGSGSGNSAWNSGSPISNFQSPQAFQTSSTAYSSQLPASSSDMGARLASSIGSRPVPPNCRPGYCYRGVKHHLRQVGVNLTGGSAYMAADQLAQDGRFREVQVSRQQLRSLPAGAIVVWDRNPGAGKRHGHISIATGDGREASDRIRNQSVNYPSRHRVFIPN